MEKMKLLINRAGQKKCFMAPGGLDDDISPYSMRQ